MNHEIKVLFLDIDNTLLDFDAGAAWGMEQCFQKAGLEYRTEMFSVFTEENNKIWQKIERRELTMDNLDTLPLSRRMRKELETAYKHQLVIHDTGRV